MFKISTMAAVISVSLGLGGCNVAPVKRDTYNAINDAVKGAAATTTPAAQPDAVEAALLPPVAALAQQLPKARAALDERFNVAFNNVPARQFFTSIVAGTRYNMLVHPEIGGTISANLKDVTLFQALDAVRELYGYDYKVEGTQIYIKPLTMQTRLFHVNYLTGARKGSSNLRVSSTSVSSVGATTSGGSGSTGNNGNNNTVQNPGGLVPGEDSSNLTTTSNADFWRELKMSLEAIVGSADGGRQVVLSPQSGVIVIRAMPEELRNVDMYLKATQLSVDRQVILEAKILEVQLNSDFQTGINWASFASIKSGHTNRISTGFIQPGGTLAPLPFNGGKPPNMTTGNGLTASSGFGLSSAATAAGSMFGLAFQTANFAAMISFLESQGTVHVLSSPRIATMNNQKAVLKIGTDEFYVTGVSTTTNTTASGATTSPNVTLQPFFSGVVLDVTPQIDADGNIILHVHPSVSQVTTINKEIDLGSAGSLKLPLAASSTSEMDSMVRSQDGRIVAIGGLMRQATTADRSQVPGAGDIPVLGALFRNTGQVIQKRELVVLIKPTIVDGANSWNEDLLESGKRIEALDPRSLGERR
ncbi:pilus (MSHA type) biogenesis protein MshL [Janthinobacterium sp. 1_2014MBL_MicDiv]|uniref:pilus (MSHA type) biogenesis protein MshL n=1 Tax=Janthinobacterium sp. 1_2014MBL_MicDiv TaxID=1644131 RepID=UPI0008F53FC4|nr:pilus (MSHA type) biogenesis protein MshL [Janthinobacterium sp. 1_2014MBL_MicDiv]APA71262.1 general secretion pathway protein GspD [Janthinobacterium sp. 1_2014MBL_MicDiv]